MVGSGAIDIHAHYYGGLTGILRRRTTRPFIADDAAGRPVLHAMTADTVLGPSYTDIATRIAYLDGAGIATQVMSFPGALGLDVLPAEVSVPLVAEFNGHLADVCRASNGRLLGLAGLPLADMSASVAEMRRVRLKLGHLGVILPGNSFLSIAQAETLAPVFAAADEVGALIVIHPGLAVGEAAPAPYSDSSVYRASALNLQASLAHMALTLVLGGFVDRYPNVTFHVVNLGGTLPFILERIDAIAESRFPGEPFPVETLRRMTFDTASLGPRALEVAVKVLGADRLMLGTDYPIFVPDPVRVTLEAAAITPAERARVASGTARELIARLLPSHSS